MIFTLSFRSVLVFIQAAKLQIIGLATWWYFNFSGADHSRIPGKALEEESVVSLQKTPVTKHSCTVISIPPSCCIDLNVYYGGREICRALVQMLSNSTKARQVSPSRKRHLTMEIMLAQSKWRQQAAQVN
jgi:hypothetical protein